MSRAPKAERCSVWCTACVSACRICAAEPSTQSSRVAATIPMMVRTPRPSSPTRRAHVPSNSTSPDAFDRLPSLSFSRWIANTLCVPSSSTRGTRKQVRPSFPEGDACASTRNPSDIGAEQNHLCPVSRYSPAASSGFAAVVFARTSLPPCFSVIPMPNSTPPFCAAGRSPSSYTCEVSRGSHSAASSGSVRSAGTAAWVIETGQPCPASACDHTKNPAARRRCPAGRPHASVSPAPTAWPSSRCQAGWNSTSSIRWPYRSCVRSFGGFSFASAPHRWACAEPAARPSSESSSRTSPRSSGAEAVRCRSTPSRRARSVP